MLLVLNSLGEKTDSLCMAGTVQFAIPPAVSHGKSPEKRIRYGLPKCTADSAAGSMGVIEFDAMRLQIAEIYEATTRILRKMGGPVSVRFFITLS